MNFYFLNYNSHLSIYSCQQKPWDYGPRLYIADVCILDNGTVLRNGMLKISFRVFIFNIIRQMLVYLNLQLCHRSAGCRSIHPCSMCPSDVKPLWRNSNSVYSAPLGLVHVDSSPMTYFWQGLAYPLRRRSNPWMIKMMGYCWWLTGAHEKRRLQFEEGGLKCAKLFIVFSKFSYLLVFAYFFTCPLLVLMRNFPTLSGGVRMMPLR